MTTYHATDAFSVPELYLLAAAFGGNVLFGLPEKQIYQLRGQEVFDEAHKRLIEKEILTADGKITKAGAMIIQAMEYYHQSKKYVRINNLMFAFSEHNDDELILMIEIEEQSLYKLFVVSKAIVLKMLGEKFPIISREPQEKEKSFLKEELSHQERHETEQLELGNMLTNLEMFHLSEARQEITNPAYYQQWLIFTKNEKLIMVDAVQRKYYHASQYWFLKVLFDEMEFPYKEAQ
ncbi:DUF5081 domain-containing protein [Oceanobacillus arenosus]|uniref:DUF5081 domain-containing protein n=1 Tax=Oceanobacillus arenosus TaxID=1229153 RepID=A0A3D8PMJ5_9BACI|nr:DUF5081 family protein [Oceanobacillus arenosus]RDW16458.1 DUF5081 domain-containing protein [Oceanobacillus arenosus]